MSERNDSDGKMAQEQSAIPASDIDPNAEDAEINDLDNSLDPTILALRGDDRRAQLKSLRDLMIVDLTSASKFMRGGDRAALYKRLQDVLNEIEMLGDEEDPVKEKTEEIINRRKTGTGPSNVVEFPWGKKTSGRRNSGEKRKS